MLKPLIVFDLDDTLIPSSRFYTEALAALGLDHGNYERARQRVKERLGPEHPASHQRLLYFKAYLEIEDRFSPAALFAMNDAYEANLEERIRMFWRESGRREVLLGLMADFELGVLTNETVRAQALKIRAMDPAFELFRYLVCSEEVGVEKPHPRLFDVLESRAGRREMIMVGDDPGNDLRPALDRGWFVVQSLEFNRREPGHYRVIRSLKELGACLSTRSAN